MEPGHPEGSARIAGVGCERDAVACDRAIVTFHARARRRRGARPCGVARYIPEFLLPRLYGPALRDLADTSPMTGYRAAIERADGPALLDRCLIADQSYHLPAGLLMKTDAMSMANGVEIRVPFLDRRIMELSGGCHLDLIVQQGGPTKPVLRKALRDEGAAETIWAAPKRFQQSAVGIVARRAAASLADEFRKFARPVRAIAASLTRCASCGASMPA